MEYKIIWQPLAYKTYFQEIDYIYLKWNDKEVLKFENLVSSELNRLRQNPLIGKFKENRFILVISKQTSLHYLINNTNFSIEILVFWNNQKNPQELNKLL